MTHDERHRRFETLIRLYRERERALAGRMRSAMSAHEKEARQLADLEILRGEYRERLAGVGQGGVGAAHFRNWRRFLSSLEQVVDEQTQRAQRTAAASDARRADWLSQRTRVQGLERVDARILAEQAIERRRSEQKRMDEIAGRSSKSRNPD